jgi:hypothetical protein
MKKQREEKFTDRLEPFAKLLYKLYENSREILVAKTNEDLQQIIDDTHQCTVKNCGWTTYHMREIVAYEAKIILQNRNPTEVVTQEQAYGTDCRGDKCT